MTHSILIAIRIASVVGSLTAAGYYVVCLWSARAYLRETRRESQEQANLGFNLPRVSILKPLKGVDPEIYESFRSHCDQDYPADYEIIFGVSEADDPAVEVVERLRQEFPQRRIEQIVCTERLGLNVKISNLAQMLRNARYDCLIVNDSDIRVEPTYLRRTIAPLLDPNVGLVTCLYRAKASATLGSCLESLGISTDFAPGVLVARFVEKGVRFGLGSTLAFRRRELEAIGGFESLLDYLADDYQLGKRISDLGRRVALSDVVVETFLPAYTLRQFLRHQLRWGRAIRDSRRGGYLGLIFTFGLPWALLAALANYRKMWAWGLLALVVGLRLAVALIVGIRVLGERQVLNWLLLLPLRDLMTVVVWTASLAGNTVEWRGDNFTVKDGRLIQRSE